jgi:hypothetical protein
MQVYDATPAFGKAMNLRLNDNGMEVIADFVGVPEWLAEIMPVAFPSRSVEGSWNIPSGAGKNWRFVLSACSLLGVTWPGITQLDDLPLLQGMYGEEIPPTVELSPELVQILGGDTMKLFPRRSAASANLDDIRRAFYQDFVPSRAEANWWWVRAVMTDPNQLVVEDDESGQLFMIDFSSDDKGAVDFSEPSPVRIEYVPDEAQKAVADNLAEVLVAGRSVMASWSSRADSRPETKATGGAMGPDEVRQALDLPADASDEQVHEALLAKAGLTVDPAPPDPQNGPEPTPDPVPEPDPVPDPARQPVAASNLPPGTVLIDEATWKSMQDGFATVKGLVAENDKSKREGLVAAAIADGRIPPARKDHWLKYLETDLEGGQQVLASLTPNIIPLEERGHGVTPEPESGPHLDLETVSGWSEQLFPGVRARKNQERAAAAGQFVPRSRIQADAPYRR